MATFLCVICGKEVSDSRYYFCSKQCKKDRKKGEPVQFPRRVTGNQDPYYTRGITGKEIFQAYGHKFNSHLRCEYCHTPYEEHQKDKVMCWRLGGALKRKERELEHERQEVRDREGDAADDG